MSLFTRFLCATFFFFTISAAEQSPTHLLIPVYNQHTQKTDYINIADLAKSMMPSGITINFHSTSQHVSDAKTQIDNASTPNITPNITPNMTTQSGDVTALHNNAVEVGSNNTPATENTAIQLSYFSWKHKIIMGCGIILVSYGYIWFSLKKALWLLKNQNAWCNWKADLSFEQLLTIPSSLLAGELFESLQLRHKNIRNPHDAVKPFTDFLERCDIEITTLQHYLTCVNWIYRLNIRKLFPIYEEDINAVKQKIQRLEYLKTIFFNRLSEN